MLDLSRLTQLACAVARRHFRRGIDPADLVQEALLAMLPLVDLKRAPGTLVNAARKACRAMVYHEQKHEHVPFPRGLLSEAIDPAEQVERDDLLERLWLDAHLPARQAAVLERTYWDGLDDVAIGEELGIGPGGVRMLRCRAIKKLREIMGDTVTFRPP